MPSALGLKHITLGNWEVWVVMMNRACLKNDAEHSSAERGSSWDMLGLCGERDFRGPGFRVTGCFL